MLRLLAGLGLVATTLMLSGCYLGPDYGYVRQTGYQGGAYYGQSRVYDGGYYQGSGYAPYYGSGYGYGCCYAPGVSVGLGAVWYDRPRYRSYASPRYRHYAPTQHRRQFDNRPRAGSGWRSGASRPNRPSRGAAGPGRRGPDRGSMGPRRNGGHPAAGRHRSRNP